MVVYLITYDLSDRSRESDLLDYIRGGGNWAMVSESSYAVLSEKTPTQILDDITRITNGSARTYIFTIRQPSDGNGPVEVSGWLKRNLPW